MKPHQGIDNCPYCQRDDIEVKGGVEIVEFDDAPPLSFYALRICPDCLLTLTHFFRSGALALRREFASMRQLDLFEVPTERVIQKLYSLEGKDAPSPP